MASRLEPVGAGRPLPDAEVDDEGRAEDAAAAAAAAAAASAMTHPLAGPS